MAVPKIRRIQTGSYEWDNSLLICNLTLTLHNLIEQSKDLLELNTDEITCKASVKSWQY